MPKKKQEHRQAKFWDIQFLCITAEKQNDYHVLFLGSYKSKSKKQRKAISNLGPNIGGLQKTRIIGWCQNNEKQTQPTTPTNNDIYIN